MKIVYLPFEIHLHDPVPLPTLDYVPGSRVKELQDNPPGEVSLQGTDKGIIRAPEGAAEEFGNSDNDGVPLPLISMKGPIPYGSNYIYSNWFSQGNPDWSANFPTDAATFTRKSGGWFGIPLLFGTTTRYYWRGIFVYDAPRDTAAEDTHAERGAIKFRRWIDPMSGHMGATPADPGAMASQYDLSRDAGRTPDALGFAMRGKNTVRTHTITEHTGGGASASRLSWERLYVRLRRAGAGGQFWRCRGSISNLAGVILKITPSGQIAVNNVDNVGTETLIGTTSALEVDAWKKLDVTVRYSNGAAQRGEIWLHLNGVLVLTALMPANVGLDQTQFHASSEIGMPFANYTLELDIAFWMNANPDSALSPGEPDFSGLDFRNGSRAIILRATGFAAGNGTWAGDWRSLSMFPVRDNDPQPPEALTSSTAIDELRVTTDSAGNLDAVPGGLGCIAMLIGMHGWRGTLHGQFGYKIGAAARVLATANAGGVTPEGAGTATRAWSTFMFNQVASKDPTVPFGDVELHRIKGNDAVQSGTDHLSAVCEVIGTFADEDYPSDIDEDLRHPLPFLGLHNAPYPRTPWARSSTPPISPVVIKGGTYVGNGVGQDLHFRSPVHWMWIRRTDANPLQGRWWSSMTGASIGGTVTPQPWGLPDALINPSFLAGPVAEDSQEQETIVRIAGADPEFNQNTKVYQYVAIMDPGQRFMLNGAAVFNDVNANLARNLIDTGFNPQWLFFQDTRPGASAVIGAGVRGPGHAAAEVTMLDNVSTARGTAMTMGAGQITPGNLITGGADAHLAFSAFRRDDGSGDPGVARVVKIGSYIGNGLGTRDVALSPSMGKYPLWAIVVGHAIGTASYMKDPSHTAGNSTGMDGTNVANGIIGGGIDFIRVGAALNTNLFIYNYFVVVGGDVAGPDGFSANGEFIPVEPAIAPGSQYGAQPEEPEPIEVVTPAAGPGGGLDDIDTDIAAACLPASTRVCNIALGKIGISQTIANLGTDLTESAAQMRLHYAMQLEATLRSYPWAFATKYDNALTLVDGSEDDPVNDDWIFAYRPPVDCIFVRRIVTAEKREFEPNPEMFRIGQDATGDVIFTNLEDPTIEYTCRPDCSAGRGDALFRDALAWRLAGACAPALTRIKGKEEDCRIEFEKALERARVADNREQQQDVEPPDAEWIRGRE